MLFKRICSHTHTHTHTHTPLSPHPFALPPPPPPLSPSLSFCIRPSNFRFNSGLLRSDGVQLSARNSASLSERERQRYKQLKAAAERAGGGAEERAARQKDTSRLMFCPSYAHIKASNSSSTKSSSAKSSAFLTAPGIAERVFSSMDQIARERDSFSFRFLSLSLSL